MADELLLPLFFQPAENLIQVVKYNTPLCFLGIIWLNKFLVKD